MLLTISLAKKSLCVLFHRVSWLASMRSCQVILVLLHWFEGAADVDLRTWESGGWWTGGFNFQHPTFYVGLQPPSPPMSSLILLRLPRFLLLLPTPGAPALRTSRLQTTTRAKKSPRWASSGSSLPRSRTQKVCWRRAGARTGLDWWATLGSGFATVGAT